MGEYRNLPCSKCGRNTKHKRVGKNQLNPEEYVFSRICGKEHWQCLICKTLERIDMKD